MSDKQNKQGVVREALANVIHYLSPREKREAVGMFLLLILGSLLDVFGLASLVPIIMAASRPGSVMQNKYSFWLYQALGFQSEKKFLLFLIVSLIVFFLLKNLFVTLINYQQVRFSAQLALKIIENQLNKHFNLPFWYFSQVGSAHLSNSTVTIPNIFVVSVVRQLFALFSELIIVVIIVFGILIYQPTLFFILVVVLVPTTMFTYRALRNRSMAIGNRIDELRPLSYNLLSDTFVGFIELKLANKQQRFKERILTKQQELQDLEAISYLYSMLPLKVIEMAAMLAVATIFLYSLFFSSNPESLVTIIGLFAAGAYRLMPSVNRLILALVSLKQHRFTYDNLADFREYASRGLPPQQPLRFAKDIVFNNLSFRFPETDKPVLQNVSLTVRKGEKIGLIGASGSGKTTLMNLLLRFYTEEQGHILVDGQPLTEHNLQAWYQTIGYVKQDTFLMESSIRGNITLNDDNVDEERLQYAIEQASLREFIDSLPEGVHTQIGERGSRLSGGAAPAHWHCPRYV